MADRIGPAALVLTADLAQPAEVDRVAAEALQALGRIDVLLPNAGLYISDAVATGDPDPWDSLRSVNVNSVFLLIHAVLPQMIARESSDIVVSRSIEGHQAIHLEPVYSAARNRPGLGYTALPRPRVSGRRPRGPFLTRSATA